MCGIIAIISNNQNIDKKKIILNGLKQLQNRGYDSAGIATINSQKSIEIIKYATTLKKDSIDNIKENIDKINDENFIIGHTRWATHGDKSDINSHPHLSFDNTFCVVHNGIIENYYELKLFLESKNIFSRSETDTEIISNLLAYFYTIYKDLKKTIDSTLLLLNGTYALIICTTWEENKLICVRKGSPLLIGKNKDYIIVGSEKSAFQNVIHYYFYLDDNDILMIDKNLKIISKKKYNLTKFNYNNFDLDFKPYRNWLEKEIYEQYEASKRAISYKGRLFDNYVKLGGLEDNIDILKNIDNIILLGCGTSYNAGFISKYYFQSLCKFNIVQIINASEFSFKNIPLIGNSAVLFLSQSGETRDLYNCIKIADDNNCFKIGVINTVDSLISKQMDCGCYLNAGREVSIGSTKSFINQLIVLNLIALWFSQLQNCCKLQKLHFIQNLHELPELIQITLEDNKIDILFNLLKDINSNVFILGKGKFFPLAKEASLKIKEICYIHAEAFESSELKHGPYSLLNEESLCILFISDDENYDKLISTYEQIKSRKSKIFVITNIEENNFENYLYIKNLKYIQEILYIIPIQLVCLKIAEYRNINPDKLRNLAKCVTTD